MGTSFFRSHNIDHGAIYFGKKCMFRFDDPERSFGVLYLSASCDGAFIETFNQYDSLTADQLAVRCLTELRSKQNLKFVDLRSPGALAAIRADARLFCGPSYENCRKWSRSFYRHPSDFDGIVYPARHDPSESSFAVFDKRASFVQLSSESWLNGSFESRKRLASILKKYRLELIESRNLLKKRPQSAIHTQGSLFDA